MTITRSISSLFMLVMLLGLQACGGGGGGGGTIPLADQNGEGIYSGTATVDVNTNITDLKGMIYGTRIMVFSVLSHVLYDGTLDSVTSDNFTATLDLYENGVKTQTGVAASGKVLTAYKITGTIGTAGIAGNQNGTFSLIYDSVYTRGATLARIYGGNGGSFAGTAMSTTDVPSQFGFRLTAPEFVSYSDSLDPGCGYTGNVTIPSTAVNIFALDTIVITNGNVNCPLIGTGPYNGLSTTLDIDNSGTTTDKKVYIALTDGTNSIFAVATR